MGTSHGKVGAQCRCSKEQRVGNIVGIAHIGKFDAFEFAFVLDNCLKVCQSLAGMLFVGKPVDDWNIGIGGQADHRFVGESAGHDCVYPAL